jgi:predicted DNA-binding transcriptional regulator AlpA
MNIDTTIADSAAAKMATGSLMTLGEVAARLAVSQMTVHRLPLTSIRLGRSLRFDPQDLIQFIQRSKEPAVA